jgi:DNA polymerase-3 subunit chi
VTEVSFRTNVADRVAYVGRYLRKSLRAGRAATVVGPRDVLASLSQSLWRFPPTDFVPHVLLRAGSQPAPVQSPTKLWLVESAADAPVHGVLLNLGEDAPEGFERFERVVELVPVEPAGREAGRRRWRHYQSRGYAIEHHDASGEGA